MIPPRRVAVLGLGLIGGSVALGLRRAWRPEITWYDPDPAAGRAAQRLLGPPAPSLEAAVGAAQLVVLAGPPRGVLEDLARIPGSAPQDAVVTDCASVKGAIVERGRELLGGRFVGAHPMTGSHRSGFGAARADLFEGCTYLVMEGASPAAEGLVWSMAQALGANPVRLGVEAHDAAVAVTSHLVHFLAVTLSRTAERWGDPRLVGPGFRGASRTALGSPTLWLEVLRQNRAQVMTALDAFRDEWLEGVRGLWSDDEGVLLDWLLGGQHARRALTGETDGEASEEAHP